MARCSRVCGITPSSAATTSEREVDARRAGDHRAHERLVAGHVDDADVPDAVEHERREAEVDRDAAALLLGQAVGVDAGERAHERGLAVIDVARGAEDHGVAALTSAASSQSSMRAQRPAVGEMLGRGTRAAGAGARAPDASSSADARRAGEEAAQRGARLGGSTRPAGASRPQRAQSAPPEGWLNMTVALGVERRWHSAQTSTAGAKPELGDDAPRAGERRAARVLVRRGGERVERGGDGVEQRRIGGIATEAQRELGDGATRR